MRSRHSLPSGSVVPAAAALGCACLVAACADATAPEPANRVPVVAEAFASPSVVCPGQATSLTVDVQDPDGDEVTVAWSPPSGAVDGLGTRVAWSAPQTPGRYSVHARVSDGRGGQAEVDLDVDVREGTLLGAAGGAVVTFDADGRWHVVVPVNTRNIEIMGRDAWVQAGPLCRLDVPAGRVDCGESGAYPAAPGGMGSHQHATLLPGGGLAILDNLGDSLAIRTAAGTLWKSFRFERGSAPAGTWQSMDGAVVGRSLMACCTNDNEIVRADLVDGTFGVFAPEGLGWSAAALRGRLVYALAYGGGAMHYGLSNVVLQSTSWGGVRELMDVGPEYHVTALAVMGRHVYAGVNHAGKVYRADVVTGATELFAEGLGSVTDLECLPGPPGA